MAEESETVYFSERVPLKQRVRLVNQHWFRTLFSEARMRRNGHFIGQGMSSVIYSHIPRQYPEGNHIICDEKPNHNFTGIAVSPDGTRLFKNNDRGQVTEFDLTTNTVIRVSQQRYTIYTLECSPKYLMLGTREMMVTLLNRDSHSPIWQTMVHNGYIFSVFINEDIGRAFAGGHMGRVSVLSLSNGEELKTIDNGHGIVYSLFADQYRLISYCESGMVNVWDVQTMELIQRTEHNGGYKLAISFSADQSMVAISGDGVTLCEWPSMKKVKKIDGIRLQFHPVNPQLYAILLDGKVKMFHLEMGDRCVAILKGIEMRKDWFAFTPDGLRIITRVGDKINSWEVAQSNEKDFGMHWMTDYDDTPEEPKAVGLPDFLTDL